MPQLLRRGAVVRRGRRWAVVWRVLSGDRLQLLPLLEPENRRVGQVELSLLMAGELRVPPSWVIEVGLHEVRLATGWRAVGALRGPIVCSLSQIVARVASAEWLERKWLDQRAHGGEAREVSARVSV